MHEDTTPDGRSFESRPPSRRVILTAVGLAAAVAPVPARKALAMNAGPPLSFRDAIELRAALRRRYLSARDLVDHAIARIETLDPRINAVVVRDFDRARAAAAEADRALAAGEDRPLLGIPMTVKESFNVAGLPTTWGLAQHRAWRPAEDAVTVARLKAAGAIIIGKTNVPFLLADWQSYNEIYGTTNNPWDVGRTPGGSSGGSAAALAAGYVPLEMGSDIGGSLRVPAHFCGVFAHKPSQALVPMRGHTPPGVPPVSRDVDLAVAGPMARTARDLSLLLDVVAGPDAPNATGYRLDLPPARHQALRDFRVLLLDRHPLLPTGGEVRDAIEAFVARLARTGATVARSSPLLPDLDRAARAYLTLLFAFIGADMPDAAYERMGETVRNLRPDNASLTATRLRGMVAPHRDWVAADRTRTALMEQWRAVFRAWDIVLAPVMPTTAFPHDQSPYHLRRIVIDGHDVPYDDQLIWPGLATLPGLPATAFPIGLGASGLPVGMQAIGPFLEDRTTLAFAELVEREFGGFVAPPGFDR
jgi:amidase